MSANASNDSFSTPKQTKRLGLRRSSSILRDKKATGSVVKTKTLEVATPLVAACTPKSRLPQSDVKISYRNLEERADSNHTPIGITPGTPENPSCSSHHLQRLAVSTNCRPYRLALSKKVREKMTKKRLEFFLANELDKEEEETKKEDEIEDKLKKDEIMPMSKDELRQKIELARHELKSRQEHKKKVQDLQEAINTWKTGFSSALLDLQQKLEPRLETPTLLERLQLPQEMLKYLDNE